MWKGVCDDGVQPERDRERRAGKGRGVKEGSTFDLLVTVLVWLLLGVQKGTYGRWKGGEKLTFVRLL